MRRDWGGATITRMVEPGNAMPRTCVVTCAVRQQQQLTSCTQPVTWLR